jgi:predicted kinase
MEAIILIGIQASGKSTFYKEKFFNSHIRISNDLLKTKNREKLLLEYCLQAKMSFVIDNTNVTKAVREKYIRFAQNENIAITGYYFKSDIKRSLERNKKRLGKERIPDAGIFSMLKKLERPSIEEGFTKLFYVNGIDNKFIIEEWMDEV